MDPDDDRKQVTVRKSEVRGQTKCEDMLMIAVGTGVYRSQSQSRPKGCEVATEMMAPCCDWQGQRSLEHSRQEILS